MMFYSQLKLLFPLAAVSLLIGAGTTSAGVFDFFKFKIKSQCASAACGHQPDHASCGPVELPQDIPCNCHETQCMLVPSPSGMPESLDATGCARPPAYSPCATETPCSSCTSCREPRNWFERMAISHTKTKRRMSGDSYYCDSPPLFGPRYGHHSTCWRPIPNDCRCATHSPATTPMNYSPLPPADSIEIPTQEVAPPPPQIGSLRKYGR